ncbi:MAG: sulfatase-like hydrolase/transferase [Woeseiaceae bacterium]|nr:sulfatase-like hydrolase/transferase [Woeseiaceae bacterium]
MNAPPTRRDFLRTLGAGAALLARSPAGFCADEKQRKPNIIIILADDLGWADVGYHGGRISTPAIDRLAREGVRLENFHACPLCSPTRAGLMTGRWPIRYGMGESVITPWRKYGLPPSERTLADLVARAGYERRGVIGKWHLGHYKKEYLPLNRGFTHFYGHYNGAFDYFTHKREGQLDWHRNFETSRDEGYSTDLIGREAARFIDESPVGKPFFLYVPFNAPHLPLQAKEQDIAKYSDIDNEKKRIYAAMVDSMDQAIGRILKAVDAKGIADNTFVLFFSDNGGTSYGDNRPWRGGKGAVYEGGVRVPAVVRWPVGISGGRRVDAMMGYIDVYPTVKRIAGVTEADPNPLDGCDMLDMIRGGGKPPKRNWFSYIAQGNPDKTAICDGTWKLLVMGGSVLDVTLDRATQPGDSKAKPSVELFRLDRDPGEQTNLVAKHPEIVARLLERLKEFRRLKISGVPDYREGRKGFKAPKDWLIRQ